VLPEGGSSSCSEVRIRNGVQSRLSRGTAVLCVMSWLVTFCTGVFITGDVDYILYSFVLYVYCGGDFSHVRYNHVNHSSKGFDVLQVWVRCGDG
jgi:hypothetical protein